MIEEGFLGIFGDQQEEIVELRERVAELEQRLAKLEAYF